MLRMIDLFAIEAVIGAPPQLTALLDGIAGLGTRPRFASLQQVVIGGRPSPELVRRAQDLLCREVIALYASPEIGIIASAHCATIEHIPGAVGYPAPGVTVEIVDEHDMPVPAGVDGRVRCRTDRSQDSPGAANPQSAHASSPVWLHLGDIGHLTTDGILCIVGRSPTAPARARH
jgi:acyl-coenzyme A synthetase/AMP-(fatty) acid ligase